MRLEKNDRKESSWFHRVLRDRSEDSLESFFKNPEKYRSLKLALQSLHPKERTALILRFIKRLSLHQISDILGMSFQAFENMYNRVTKELLQRVKR